MTPEQIKFDFMGESGLASLDRLEAILDTGHWSNRGLDYAAKTTALLLRLLQQNGIVVFRVEYDEKTADYPDELRESARRYAGVLHKRDNGFGFLPALAVFSLTGPDFQKTEHGAMFFPDQEAYLRAGGLTPERLLELLEREGCLRVLVIPPYGENAVYVFARNMSRDELVGMMDEMREIQENALFEAMQKAGEKSEGLIPPVEPITE